MLAVLTTIQSPTSSVHDLIQKLQAVGSELIAIGDKKGPSEFAIPATRFFSLEQQLALPFELARALPVGHYARKNLGYLLAIREKADCIYETDDDNAPNARWALRTRLTSARQPVPRQWVNVYRLFTNDVIWPRGFPLELVTDQAGYQESDTGVHSRECPIQQGLADLSPDVDAVWRLTQDREFRFEDRPSVWLPPGAWCPFNSQTTWWWPEAYPLLYLPSYCSFRMTDIWRSFIAQRCLWEMGLGIVFHAPEALQERNPHNLLRDFEEEVPGYLQNQKIVVALERLALRSGQENVEANVYACYEELVRIGVLEARELPLVTAWLSDLRAADRERSAAV